ncbi:hypothetical protein F5Y19DRAFT_51824 [Xylariaceae sp. FL1651]|nr:hypothetical protein F5Y19DRAFT_51824 [Xylariaceae sp. FL1651]
MRATYRAFCKKREVEKLRDSLKDDERTLRQMISEKLLPSIDHLSVQQSKEFTSLNAIGQKLINGQVEQRKTQEYNNLTLTGKLDDVHHDVQYGFNNVQRTWARESLLERLFFPEIDRRQSEIRDPAPRTLNWLFESDSGKESRGCNIIHPKWSNFGRWLREDTSTYWISGKPGSGKSTLMAHIVHDIRTRKELETWSQGHHLVVLSFFFRRAGSELQQSVVGLLRSLLYQLCKLQSSIVDTVYSRLSVQPTMIPAWTERVLLDCIVQAVQAAVSTRFCFFLDGLDEHTGDYSHLLDCISHLQGLHNVKCCVSSRPELAMRLRYKGLKHLRLQDLNQKDIKKFVKGSLDKYEMDDVLRTELTSEITQRAEGMFLWACLVTQSLSRGFLAGDDKNTLLKRLDTLPKDLNKLYEQMFAGVEEVYKERFAYYLQLMDFGIDPSMWTRQATSIPIIATSVARPCINTYEKFAMSCQRTETQINTCSAGLLEAHSEKNAYHSPPRPDETQWRKATGRFISDPPQLSSQELSRRRCIEADPYPAMLEYEDRTMRWIHRSAFDFFFESNSRNLLSRYNITNDALIHRIGESSISYLAAAPSFDDAQNKPRYESQKITKQSVTLRRFREILLWLRYVYLKYTATASALLDKLLLVISQFDKSELSGAFVLLWSGLNTDQYAGTVTFWSECTQHGLMDHFVSRIDLITQGEAWDSVVAQLLALAMLNMAKVQKRSFGSNPGRFYISLTHNLFGNLDKLVCGLNDNDDPQSTQFGCTNYKLCLRRMWVDGGTSDSKIVYDSNRSISWEEPKPGFNYTISPTVTKRLFDIICYSAAGAYISRYVEDHEQEIPERILRTVKVLGMYMAPEFGLNQLLVQISADVWYLFHQKLPHRGEIRNKPSICSFVIGDYDPVDRLQKAIRVFCVPSMGKQKLFRHKLWRDIDDGSIPWDPFIELDCSQLVSLHPSSRALRPLLSLLGVVMSVCDGQFYAMRRTQQQREEVCGMLLSDIESDVQALDASQELIAATCVRAGLLDSDIEEEWPNRILATTSEV